MSAFINTHLESSFAIPLFTLNIILVTWRVLKIGQVVTILIVATTVYGWSLVRGSHPQAWPNEIVALSPSRGLLERTC